MKSGIVQRHHRRYVGLVHRADHRATVLAHRQQRHRTILGKALVGDVVVGQGRRDVGDDRLLAVLPAQGGECRVARAPASWRRRRRPAVGRGVRRFVRRRKRMVARAASGSTATCSSRAGHSSSTPRRFGNFASSAAPTQPRLGHVTERVYAFVAAVEMRETGTAAFGDVDAPDRGRGRCQRLPQAQGLENAPGALRPGRGCGRRSWDAALTVSGAASTRPMRKSRPSSAQARLAPTRPPPMMRRS